MKPRTKPVIDFDSPPEDRLSAVKSAAKASDAELVHLIERDANGKILSIALYTEGELAEKLELWIKQQH